MRATMMVDPEWLADRRRRGVDRWDEVWDGVLHVPPTPTSDHQRVELKLARILAPLAETRGFETFTQLSVLDPRDHNRNYRTPDVLVVEPKHVIRRGTEGPVELAIEILSPDDESRDKLPFYAQRGVKELWIVDPDTRVAEVYVLRGHLYVAVLASDGVTRAPALDLALATVPGPKLAVSWTGGSSEI